MHIDVKAICTCYLLTTVGHVDQIYCLIYISKIISDKQQAMKNNGRKYNGAKATNQLSNMNKIKYSLYFRKTAILVNQ